MSDKQFYIVVVLWVTITWGLLLVSIFLQLETTDLLEKRVEQLEDGITELQELIEDLEDVEEDIQ